ERVDQARLANIGTAGERDLDAPHGRQRRERPCGAGKAPLACEQLAASLDVRGCEGGGGSERRRLHCAHDEEPLTPVSLFFLKNRLFKASHAPLSRLFKPPAAPLRLSHSSILAPCLCMITLCCRTERVLFQAQ